MVRYCGFSEYFHDAGLAIVLTGGDIEFAGHAERYSKIKFDKYIPDEMWRMLKDDDHVTFYEDHSLRRKTYSFNWNELAPQHALVELDALTYDDFITHHQSHAAAGYYTRPWESEEDTVILTVDGVGEWQTMGIYNHKLECLDYWDHPRSLGLLYTQVVKVMGLRTCEDEYVVMGRSAYGEPIYGDKFIDLFENIEKDDITRPQYRKLIGRWNKEISTNDLCASVQLLAEYVFMQLAERCAKYGKKLVVSGGCAQNIIAMSQIKQSGLFEDMWVAVAPTDAGSALGAAAYQYAKRSGNSRVNWNDAYLGHDMGCTINPKEVVDHLLEHEYCGIASGRAEYGPRALGNRSLIADPRKDVKDTVNMIKQRQAYRPFAPAILEEHADEYFEGPMNEYMQYQCVAKHDYKSVTHVDGTARVQLVRKDSNTIFRKIIEEFYDRTGVPMLLNTSLNIRGMPMVNDHKDAKKFEERYNVKVFV